MFLEENLIKYIQEFGEGWKLAQRHYTGDGWWLRWVVEVCCLSRTCGTVVTVFLLNRTFLFRKNWKPSFSCSVYARTNVRRCRDSVNLWIILFLYVCTVMCVVMCVAVIGNYLYVTVLCTGSHLFVFAVVQAKASNVWSNRPNNQLSTNQ